MEHEKRLGACRYSHLPKKKKNDLIKRDHNFVLNFDGAVACKPSQVLSYKSTGKSYNSQKDSLKYCIIHNI